MAKIIIEAEDAYDLRATMLALFGDADGGDEVADDTPQPVSRGGRRKKASPAAAAALAAATDMPASGVQTASPEPSPGAGAGPTATTVASPSEPAPAAGGAVSKEAVATAMTKAMEVTSPLISQKALTDAGLPVRLSEIPAEKYAEAADVLNKLIASV